VPLLLLILLLPLSSCRRDPADGRVRGVGTIEVVEVDVAPSTPGRVARVWVDEGATVHAGDTLVTLTVPTLAADVEARRARASAASATLRDLEAGARTSELARAAADVRAAEAEAVRTARDVERLTPLAAQSTVSAQQLDAARAAAAMAAARRDAARQALQTLREGTRPERVQAARADVAAARAAVAQAQATQRDLVLVAPVSGAVLGRHAEPGEVLGAGQAAVTLGETSRPYTRIYVDERALPLVQVGQRATAVLDAFPDRAFEGRVVAVSDRAEFTPRVALTEEQRADLLFGVKVEFDDGTGMLKSGLPVTVTLDRPRIAAPPPASSSTTSTTTRKP